ncbi:polysaccharide deacetylase family protein [Duganella sp. FT80W]|uniref:Polysaccharide deacetylase family protein n=1 Tax=Duganella guangzhouensis TaxID=2666084 RepID=A0A6I2LAX9_9BURK|nr:polysaccharide deacetylase family protein [Duganella guangzhouensis]MRW93906.1 polysaccharide deacetylase family protein [Duganella guangzhouensis]
MTLRICSILAALLLAHAAAPALAVAPAAAPAEPAFAWPNGARAAVSLAYDDALDSQLDHAIPTLDKYGLKGSFYLQLSNPSVERRMADWRAAAARGHELGNHSLFHQCSRRTHDWVQPARDLDTISMAQMQQQVLLANTMLTAIDGQQQHTYTVPCGDTQAQDGNYLPALHNAFVAIKVGGEAVTPSMQTLNPYAVGVYAPEGLSGQQLIALVEQAGARGTMVNFTFHGVGGDYIVTSAAAHEELVRYLAAHRDQYWTDSFVHIMTYVSQHRGHH